MATTLELNVMERLSVKEIFTKFQVRTVAKIKDQKDILDRLELTDDEKKVIEWVENEGRVNLNQKIASALKVEFTLTKWQEEVLTATLIYSELLDDFSPAFFRIHEVLVTGKK